MSGISGVGYGGYVAKPNFCGEAKKKESHAVRNGALIGAGVGIAGEVFLVNTLAKGFGVKVSEIGYGNVAGGLAIAAAVAGLIGAGIGAIVKACSGSTEEKIGK